MERNKQSAIICTIVLGLCTIVPGKIIYVDDDASGPGDGTSWQNAYKYLQDALTEARAPGGAVEIRVAQGVYRPDRTAAHPNGTGDQERTFFYVLYGMTIKGGFAGRAAADPNERDIGRYPSVLSGDLAGNDVELADPLDARGEPTRSDNSYHVVTNFMTGPRGGGREGPPGLSTELDGFVIAAGHAPGGGKSGMSNFPGAGIYIGGSQYVPYAMVPKVTIRNCTIVGNYAGVNGGGVACDNVRLAMVNCVVAQNGTLKVGESGGGNGGGLYAWDSGVELDNCRFERNRAGSNGGALYSEDSDVKVTRCDFDHNRAASGGANSLHGYDATGEFVACMFTHNRADRWDGGAMAISLNGQVRNCHFFANEAASAGGAIYNGGFRVATTNCLFIANTAREEGGVINQGFGELHLQNCTSHGNRAPQGQFLFCAPFDEQNHVYVENSIVANGGNEIWNDRRGVVTVRYTDLPGGLAAVHDPQNRLTWGPGNIDADPCFASPGIWDPNGTPDETRDDIWVDGDYHLKSPAGRWDPNSQRWVMDDVSSPCIDAGDSNDPVGNEPEPNGGRINMGAYGGTAEASKSRLPKTFDERLKDLLATVEGQSPGRPTVETKQGYVDWLWAANGTHFAVDPDYRDSAREAANWFLAQWQDLFADTSKPVIFALQRVDTHYVDRAIVGYTQMYAGVQVLAAGLTIIVDPSGGVKSVQTGILIDTSALDSGAVSVTPSIDAAEAQNKAIAFLAERYRWDGMQASPPILMIYAPVVLHTSGPIRLIWNIDLHGASPGRERRVYIDAHSGEVVGNFSLLGIP